MQSRRRYAGSVAHRSIREKKNVYRILVGKPEAIIPVFFW